jgi:nucleoside-diphosphate-sugar epimerase
MGAAYEKRQNLNSNRIRVLVTGAGGRPGGRLAALLADEIDVLGAVNRSTTRSATTAASRRCYNPRSPALP